MWIDYGEYKNGIFGRCEEKIRRMKIIRKRIIGVIFAKQNKPEEHRPWAIINVNEPQYPQYIKVIRRRGEERKKIVERAKTHIEL